MRGGTSLELTRTCYYTLFLSVYNLEMNSKKRRVTRKRCVRKCKKQTSRKLRGSRRYGGGRLSRHQRSEIIS